MLIKCETKSNRVKGLSFHPKLSWILASLHNGVIQMWDYRIGSLLERFEDHEGPVRGVDFHPSQPLFVSGGDDYRVKVWNYRQRRCIFTLLGHLDYIRTVYFHHEYPWVVSASDDQTVRIWNWQSRSCLAVLTGHGHYVMCAQFHPKSDLVVSASLDQMIRVWDISGLREKTCSIGGGTSDDMKFSGPPPLSVAHQTGDMFGTSDAVCKFVLEGHDRGVNWAAFHPTNPLIASGADDRHIKLWRYNDSKAWEVDTLRGHFNNVSCVMFHPTRDLLISNSEDRTIRVWDVTKRTVLHTFRRENDRCWVLTAQTASNLIGVGHDSGMVVFKLDRERPPHKCYESHLYLVKDKWLSVYDLQSDVVSPILAVRKTGNLMASSLRELLFNPFNPTELNVILLFQETEGPCFTYDLIAGKDLKSAIASPGSLVTKSGSAQSVAFVARNRFALLESSGAIGIYTLNNELGKRFDPPSPVEKIFSASKHRLLLKSDEKMILFDLLSRRVLNEISGVGSVRSAVWSPDGRHVALIAKHNIFIVNANLECLHSVHENIRVKSGCWDDCGAFIYATLSHVKYCLTNGDHGIIYSLSRPIYVFKVSKQKIHYLDRQQNIHSEPFNSTEVMFKLALHRRQFDQVALHIRNGRLCGNAVVGYLKRKGYPEVAMQFVSDPKTRFNLALEYDQLEEAMAACNQLDDGKSWKRLTAEAWRLGNFQVVETSCQKIKAFDKLSFLYLITGNVVKLRKMMKIASMTKDVMSRFHNALMLGDVEERIRILTEVGQTPLACATTRIHGLEAGSKQLLNSNEDMSNGMTLPTKPKLFFPVLPIHRHVALGASNNWPLLKGALPNAFANALEASRALSPEAAALSLRKGIQSNSQRDGDQSGGAAGRYNIEDAMNDDDLFYSENVFEEAADTAEVWDDFGDTLSMNGDVDDAFGGATQIEDSTLVARGESAASRWVKWQPMVADLAAAGRFRDALGLLHKRIGLVNAGPLKEVFSKVSQATYTFVPTLPQVPPLQLPLLKSGQCVKDSDIKPRRLYDVASILELVRLAQKEVTGGNFKAALGAFRSVLWTIPFVVVDTSTEEEQVEDFLQTCRSYILAMRIECTRLDLPPETAARNIELAAYFASCKMAGPHMLLVLRRVIGVCNKGGNYITAAALCRRLVDEGCTVRGAEDVIKKAKHLLVQTEQRGVDKHVIDWDPAEKYDMNLCVVGLKRLHPGAAVIRCPYCQASADAKHKDSLCPSCELSTLGTRALGLALRPVS